MNNINMFCISLRPEHLNIIKDLNYIPVGLGVENFSNDWLTDKNKFSIAEKNPYYGEYTFHYSLWKNNLFNLHGWIGFCQYRKFWSSSFKKKNINDYNIFKRNILNKIPINLSKYETIIGQNLYINQFRFSKFVKHNFKKMIFNPELIFNKNKRTIKFHFDMMHGYGNLDKAIEVLDTKDRNDFEYFVNTEIAFNPHNMFICKNLKILNAYYESVFPWLHNCEKIFGFKGLKNYGLKRIYAFLAERYMSFWFKKYTNFTTMQIQFKDISDFL